MYRGRSGPSLSDRAASSGVPARGADHESAEREPVGSASPEPPVPRPFVPPGPVRPRPVAAEPERTSAPGHSPGPGPASSPARPARPAPAARRGASGGRHCWVRDPPDAPGIWPGLLVEWRQREDGWHGRVAYTVAGAHGPVLVEAWLPADRLKQG